MALVHIDDLSHGPSFDAKSVQIWEKMRKKRRIPAKTKLFWTRFTRFGVDFGGAQAGYSTTKITPALNLPNGKLHEV
jgi:hypothetical protein